MNEFLVEGKSLVKALLESRQYRLLRVVLASDKHGDLLRLIPRDVEVQRVSAQEASALAGYPFHRGVLAWAERNDAGSFHDWFSQNMAKSQKPGMIVFCPRVTDEANVGAIIRNAAGLGADAVILGKESGSPWSRKAIRSSGGGIFRIPVFIDEHPVSTIQTLSRYDDTALFATTLDEKAVVLDEMRDNSRIQIVLFGAEEDGLPENITHFCHHRIYIPMANGMNSLNVAATAAIVLHHLPSIRQKSLS